MFYYSYRIRSFRFYNTALILFLISITFWPLGYLKADETIIQKEKMSFDRCLTVIVTSEDKLSIPPKVFKVNDIKRVAVFQLADGKLKITCDGKNELVIVSTETN